MLRSILFICIIFFSSCLFAQEPESGKDVWPSSLLRTLSFATVALPSCETRFDSNHRRYGLNFNFNSLYADKESVHKEYSIAHQFRLNYSLLFNTKDVIHAAYAPTFVKTVNRTFNDFDCIRVSIPFGVYKELKSDDKGILSGISVDYMFSGLMGPSINYEANYNVKGKYLSGHCIYAGIKFIQLPVMKWSIRRDNQNDLRGWYFFYNYPIRTAHTRFHTVDHSGKTIGPLRYMRSILMFIHWAVFTDDPLR